jgi:MoaA/NifB/PqqE/SkfB family radical SAM enzyme
MAQYKIQTFTAVAGTIACDAKCPFCVASMTTSRENEPPPRIDERWFYKALTMAEKSAADSFLITGKGEPTLWPDQVTKYLRLMANRKSTIPFWEIQSNALRIGRLAEGMPQKGLDKDTLRMWYDLGLDVFAISRVDVLPEPNRSVYSADYPDLAGTVEYLRDIGFKVRLCIMMQMGCVEDYGRDMPRLLEFCRQNGVSQLTLRPLRAPKRSHDDPTTDYVRSRGVTDMHVEKFLNDVHFNGTLIRDLVHGAKIYDVRGQNVCVSDCLTLRPDDRDIRSLIFMQTQSGPQIFTQWDYPGSNIV